MVVSIANINLSMAKVIMIIVIIARAHNWDDAVNWTSVERIKCSNWPQWYYICDYICKSMKLCLLDARRCLSGKQTYFFAYWRFLHQFFFAHSNEWMYNDFCKCSHKERDEMDTAYVCVCVSKWAALLIDPNERYFLHHL